MKRRSFLRAGALATLCGTLGRPTHAQKPTAVYVAPGGSDSAGTGTGEKPLATLSGALKLLRGKPGVKTIYLRGGIYELAETVVLTDADSDLRIEAWPGESVTLSGGTRLKTWKRTPEGRWRAVTPLLFDQLYGNGERLSRPRLPKNGYYRVARDFPLAEGRTYDRLCYSEGEVSENWANLEDIEAFMFPGLDDGAAQSQAGAGIGENIGVHRRHRRARELPGDLRRQTLPF